MLRCALKAPDHRQARAWSSITSALSSFSSRCRTSTGSPCTQITTLSTQVLYNWLCKLSMVETNTAKKNDLFKQYEGWRLQVGDMEATELHELLGKGDHSVVVVDVRQPEEQAVSMIPGGTLTKAQFEEQKGEIPKDKLVVTYCTAGFRSGKYAAQLVDEGYTVKNLKGSILSWTYAGYPLEAGDGSKAETKKVHTFGEKWGALCGDGYEPVWFKTPGRGVWTLAKGHLPKWLGGGW